MNPFGEPRESHRWRLAVRIFVGALMVCLALAGYAFLGPKPSGLNWLDSRTATAQSVRSPNQDVDAIISQADATGQSLQAVLDQIQQRATASSTTNVPAPTTLMVRSDIPGQDGRLVHTVSELQQLYPMMDRLMQRMQSALSAGGGSARELADMGAEMQAILARIEALKAQEAYPSGNEIAVIGARIDDITRRVNAVKAGNRTPSADEIADVRAEIVDVTRRMNALMLRRQAETPTLEVSTGLPPKADQVKGLMQDAVKLMQEVMSSPSPDPSRVERMQKMLADLPGLLDEMRVEMQSGTWQSAAGLSSPMTGYFGGSAATPNSDFNNRMNTWLAQMRADASSKASGGMMEMEMGIMSGMLRGH